MLWGGRFKEKLNNDAMEFSSSLSFDINLLEEDIRVSTAHAEMLAKVGIISQSSVPIRLPSRFTLRGYKSFVKQA